MKPYSFLACSALAILLAACGSDAPQSNTGTTAPTVSAENPKEKPEVYLYATTVDKLNLRAEPNKNGKVITQLAEGDFVESTGEVSSNKEEAQLRGITYLEPYFKVTTTTPEQYNGWAYGGAKIPLSKGLLIGACGGDQAQFAKRGYDSAIETQLLTGIIDYCGIPEGELVLLYDLLSDDATRQAAIARAGDLGRDYFGRS